MNEPIPTSFPAMIISFLRFVALLSCTQEATLLVVFYQRVLTLCDLSATHETHLAA
jgi:hypothetical protein